MIELDKISKRIDEFSDYGELEMMKQYVDDVKNVQKRITDAEKLIDWIRNVNIVLFCLKLTIKS
jgi:dynein heavy chain